MCVCRISIKITYLLTYMYPVLVNGDKIVVNAERVNARHYGDMYPLVSGYKLLVWDTCIQLHCIWCKV